MQARTDKGESEPERPAAKAKRLAGEREPARQEARQAFKAAMADPAAVKPEHIDALRAHLHTLTRDEARAKLKELGPKPSELAEQFMRVLAGQAPPRPENPIHARILSPVFCIHHGLWVST
jgi:hypothetical protein